MKSMTGYGKSVYQGEGFELTVEIKTVNNRFLDINCKYPKGFAALEEVIRNTVKQRLARGRADIYVNFTDSRENGRAITADCELAKAYKLAAEKVSAATGLSLEALTLTDILRFPEVIKTGDDEDKEFLRKPLTDALNSAVTELEKMREREGEKLKTDMLLRMEEIESTVNELTAYAPKVTENYREKLRQRIEDYLKDTPVDESRLLNEVAAYSDRSNIDEELTRLKSHIVQFRKICGEASCGKKLDFLVQEFNREANTVCSKSNDVSVTDCALKLKCEIEKIREQIQNVE